MDTYNTPKYTFEVTNSTSAAAKKELCCDAAHKERIFATRYGCIHPKLLFLYDDGSFALVHAVPEVMPGFLIRPPAKSSLAVLARKKAQEDEEKISVLCPGPKQLGEQYPVASVTSPPSSRSAITNSPLQTISATTHALEATVSHATAPALSKATVKSSASDGFAMPSSFPFEAAVAKGNKLAAALQEAADSCAAAKAADEVKKAAVLEQKKYMDIEKDEKLQEEDWEIVEGVAVDDDYVVVRSFD